MNMFFRNATENEVEILTRMSRESFLSDTAFGGSGGPTGYDDFDYRKSTKLSISCEADAFLNLHIDN